jgi:hypothetical protein
MSKKANQSQSKDNFVQNKSVLDSSSGLPLVPSSTKSSTCESCGHWHREDETSGQCRSLPPDVPTNEFRKAGRIFSYRLTLSTLPACSHYMTRVVSA